MAPDGGDYAAHHSDAAVSAPGGPVIEVSRNEVLAKRAAILAEAEDFKLFLDSIKDRLVMRPCGDDPVSHDVARAVTYRTVEAEDSYFACCQAWVDNLYGAAEALAEVARQYGFTEEEIAASFGGGGAPGA